MSDSNVDSAQLRRYQRLLTDALTARIVAMEQHIGNRYSFEVRHLGLTTAILAHAWPRTAEGVPFNRVFNYSATDEQADDLNTLMLPPDTVVEVLVETRATSTENYLRANGFTLGWQIPWLHIALDQEVRAQSALVVRQVVTPAERDAFATLLVAGYGYQGEQAAAWYDFARYGSYAPGFYCFVVEDKQPIAAGVVYIRDGLALLDGAATLPAQRGRGGLTALLLARLALARAHGCTHAFSRTGQGSISQRNMERFGLHVVARSAAWLNMSTTPVYSR